MLCLPLPTYTLRCIAKILQHSQPQNLAKSLTAESPILVGSLHFVSRCSFHTSSTRLNFSTETAEMMPNLPDLQAPASDPASTWLLLVGIAPCDEKAPKPPPPPVVRRAHESLGAAEDELLPPRAPEGMPGPYNFFITKNEDESIVAYPRLLVTKLLTLMWCERSLYYQIYAGLPRQEITIRMARGSKYHKSLEDRAHRTVDFESINAAVQEKVASLTSERQAYLARNSLPTFDLINGAVEHMLVRSLVVAERGEARELQVHGYIDLDKAVLCCDEAEFARAVLVNGIADMVRLERKSGALKVEVTLEAGTFVSDSVRDLARDLKAAKARMDALAPLYSLLVHEVKTRSYNGVPQDRLVVEAARDQCFFYLQFLSTLARSAEYAFGSLCESWGRCDVDMRASVSESSVVKLLVAQFPVLFNDFLVLARGGAIGFAPFDAACGQDEANQFSYSLSNVLLEPEFRLLLATHHGDKYADVDVSPLFGAWRIPLNPAYFAARAAQALHLFERFECRNVCVEYHNVKTGRTFCKKTFRFKIAMLGRRTKKAALFWRGSRVSEATPNSRKCPQCAFEALCPAINKAPEGNVSVGLELSKFIAGMSLLLATPDPLHERGPEKQHESNRAKSNEH